MSKHWNEAANLGNQRKPKSLVSHNCSNFLMVCFRFLILRTKVLHSNKNKLFPFTWEQRSYTQNVYYSPDVTYVILGSGKDIEALHIT